VAGTLADLAALDPTRPVAVVRELTKVHEEVWRGDLAEGSGLFADQPPRGEVVLVIGGKPDGPPLSDEEVDAAVRARVDEGTDQGPRQIADALSIELGVGRRRVYEAVLRLREVRGP
jgi:16S rRNA (cytidine1402-2'-O)-methyltransferase